MDKEDEIYSVASNIAYVNYNTNQIEAQSELDKYLEGYTVDKDYENSNIGTTIIRPDGRSAIIAFKGTDFKNIHDLTADVLVSSGYHRLKPTFQIIPNTRFSNAEDYFKIVQKKYGENIHLTGHSLGGSVATHISSKYDKKATIFNSGELPQDLNSPYFNSDPEMIKSYITQSDIISFSGSVFKNQKTIIVNKKINTGNKYFDSHSLANFLPPKLNKIKNNDIKIGIERERERENIEIIKNECVTPSYKKCNKKGTACRCAKTKPKTTF